MNGDISLSKALGGLRIANPDDSNSSLSRDLSVDADEPQENPSASLAVNESHAPSHQPPRTPLQNSALFSAAGEPQTRSPAREGNTGASTTMQHNTYAPPHSGPQYHSADQHLLQPHHSQYQSSSENDMLGAVLAATRPSSGVYAGSTHDVEPGSSPYNPLRREKSRSSMYALPSRSSSRSAPGYAANAGLTRETSHRDRSYNPASNRHTLPPNSASLPPRRSSKGQAGGYATVAGVPTVAEPSGGMDMPPPGSREEWQERGAAVGVRQEVDAATGRTVMRSVKKGVRDFSFGKILGEGSYSTVYLATDRQSLKEYAIKVLEKKHIIKEKKIKYVNIEKNTLNRLTDHPGIVRLYYTFQDETSLYYVLDLCNGGELLGVLKRTGTFDEECTRFYGAQILDSIEYMHSRGVIHRDLKPENVLLDDNMHVKITDFGTAKLLADPRAPPEGQQQEDNRAASFVGTAEYVSPELLTDKSAGKPSDLWAFGCIIYQLLAGRPPFKGGTEYLTFQKIVGLEYDFPAGFPPAARDLVERCLVLDPSRRLTTEHIKNHEFFDGHKFGKELWRTKAPRLRPYVPPSQEPHIINLNGSSQQSKSSQASVSSSRGLQPQNGSSRPTPIITELPPPTQLDIEWSPVLTRNNERILKLGDLMVISSPLPNSPHGKGEHGEAHKKLSRFFGGSTTKKRQRLVMITSSGRIVLAPAGGDEKKAKQEISLLGPDCSWRTQIDVKGQAVWCVDANGVHYQFELAKSSGTSVDASISVDDWIEALDKARDLAISQDLVGPYGSDNGFGDMSSMNSPASTLGRNIQFPDGGFSINDRSGRNQLSKSQNSLLEETQSKRNRFSKRQSKNGLGTAF